MGLYQELSSRDVCKEKVFDVLEGLLKSEGPLNKAEMNEFSQAVFHSLFIGEMDLSERAGSLIGEVWANTQDPLFRSRLIDAIQDVALDWEMKNTTVSQHVASDYAYLVRMNALSVLMKVVDVNGSEKLEGFDQFVDTVLDKDPSKAVASWAAKLKPADLYLEYLQKVSSRFSAQERRAKGLKPSL